jgi:signal transduction histidine kinase/FixJ family two-component response regulator
MADASYIHVLVIEDDADTRANLCDILELDDYRVATAATAAEALRQKSWSQFSAIILDRKLPDGRAEDLLPRLKQLAPDAAILIVTGFADLDGAIAALRQGAADYILKPINADALRASLHRIAEQHRLAAAKERSEAAFRTLVEAAPCMIVIFRPDHSIVYFSPFAETLTGYNAAEVNGKDFFSTFVPAGPLKQVIGSNGDGPGSVARQEPPDPATLSAREFENPVQCKDGSRRWMVWNVEQLQDYEGDPAILLVGQDITKLKQVQEQALQSERLATLGQMVTGLAHESRNALQLIQASLEMLALEVEDRPEALELVESIQAAEDRLHRLFEDIRGYAAPMTLERDVYNVAKVWRAAWQQLAGLRNGRQVSFQEEIKAGELSCSLDLFSIERVFRNIFENSLAACKDPGQIQVACCETQIERRPAIQISVRDNGPGLSSEQRRKIFDPFFTTKSQGTGLGMAIAKRIIQAHGGTIAVGANPPPGAEILLILPRGTA